ncbi:MAG TPA: hypothetical protein PKA90_15590 [Ignavibacteria bacterium]|nr:hypothetical protein [Ignavibacteria bacterium]HMR41841.1 hypothetical protein [Ignavibacteria bacterium]
MKDYTKYKRGSEWRKWDLHIHTPETKKNDQFEGSTPEEKWEKFIKSINESTEDINVIGITDYFSIENYFKFKDLVQKREIKKQFDLILPNIEIRVVPVTGSSTPINLHCIFNPDIDSEIETRFLSKLKFDYSESNFSAKKEELIRLGKALPGNASLDDTASLKAGISQYVISMETLRGIFETDSKLRENTIIVVSNKSSDGVSGIRHHSVFFESDSSSLDATRWSIYQFSDAIFSSNRGDILYFLGKGTDNKETVIEKCITLMPCFHGCDAHKNEDIFKTFENRYCWIKADPTFEGLKQTLYEPEDRVKIQSLEPDIKNERFIISEVQFIEEGKLFGNQKILLNENLNAIIGGKSSGKSLLLYSIAKSIDPEQVDKTSKRLNFEGYKFEKNFNFKVIWKNNDNDIFNDSNIESKKHKITYIPQLYINYLVEKNNKQDLNSLIQSILVQDSSFRTFFELKTQEISITTSEIERLLNEYLITRTKALNAQKKSKEIGNSKNIEDGIKKLEIEIAKGQKISNLSEKEFSDYNRLLSEKTELEKLSIVLNSKEDVLKKVLLEVKDTKTNLLGMNTPSEINLKGQIDKLLDALSEVTEDIKKIRDNIEVDFDKLIKNLEDGIKNLKIEEEKKKTANDLKKKNEKLIPYEKKLKEQKDLQKLTSQLNSEKLKLQQSIILEKQYKDLIEEYGKIRKQIAILLKKRFDLYNKIINEINATKKDIGSEILLEATLVFKKENFPLYEQTNRASVSSGDKFSNFFSNENVKYDLIPDFFSEFLRVSDNKLFFSKTEFIPLKLNINIEDVLRGLIKDLFEFDFTVTYKGDDLLNMSPGKKGTVLLILFLQLSSSEFPILIDQPEDNLDNRTIYDLLCKMIKEKKKNRQIIIVSHNANLVVATDSENIIVANQEGQGTKIGKGRYQFEYVNGSLEYSFEHNVKIKEVLLSQGIKQHVCDILEGGDEAFKQRERKYSLK